MPDEPSMFMYIYLCVYETQNVLGEILVQCTVSIDKGPNFLLHFEIFSTTHNVEFGIKCMYVFLYILQYMQIFLYTLYIIIYM